MAWFEGTVARITYRDEASGFTVARIHLEPEGSAVAVGVLPPVSVGERLRLSGQFEQHPTYGRQLRVVTAYSVAPITGNAAAIESYLASGAVRGIGPRLAQRLVAHFGSDVLRIAAEAPERLAEVPGVGPVRAARIAARLKEHSALRDALIFLGSLGLPERLAARAFRLWGERTVGIVQGDPYRLARDVPGVGFKTADRIARALGVGADSPRRAEAAVAHILAEAAEEGHTFLPPAELALRLRPLGLEAAAEAGIAALVASGRAVREVTPLGEAVYARALWEPECDAAARLASLLTAPRRPQAADVPAACGQITLTPWQRRAVARALVERVLIVTGGPGTGKTTLVRAIVTIARQRGERVLLAAPTGRAAQRLQEATGHPASTLHRLLEFGRRGGGGWGFQRHAARPLEGELLVVDEASMIDLALFDALLQAVPPGMRLVFVGDADQLPSVGPGAVLADMIAAERVPLVRLTEVFRQAEQSHIVTGAHRIRRGEEPTFNAPGGDLFFLAARDGPEVAAAIRELVASRLPAYLGLRPGEGVQVLAPLRSGPAGVDELNRSLQAVLNPPSPYKAEVRLGERTFRSGDRVMQIRNDYDKGVFNGDVGRVISVDAERRCLTVAFGGEAGGEGTAAAATAVTYEGDACNDLVLAYAVSVHKSQGSEYPAIVMPVLPIMPALMHRQLLYTALTRARRLAVLVGRREALRAYLRRT
ncbi:MAG TPA: ATP-dependent RecD-like DNA helicase, partial [Limnochordia bacterium]